MKIYKNIVLVTSAIVGVVATILFNICSPLAMASYKGLITAEKYKVLKDYAFDIATNPDIETKNDIDVTKEITKSSLIIKVDTSLYGIQATFPITTYSEKIENGIVKCEGSIDYNNVIYSEHSEVNSPLFYISLSIPFFFVIIGFLYFIFYDIPSTIIKWQHADQK